MVQTSESARSLRQTGSSESLHKNADWEAEREFRIVVPHWDEKSCQLPIKGAVIGIALGVQFDPSQIPLAQEIARVFEVEANTALLMMHNAVLVPNPVVGPDERWHRWTDTDLRTRGAVFDEDDG